MASSRKLYRSKTDRVLFGVCGGIGEYLDIDPVIIRLIFVILTIWGGVGILLYIIAIFVIPEELGSGVEKDGKDTKEEIREKVEEFASGIKSAVQDHKSYRRGSRPDVIFGIVIIVLGLMFLAGNLFSWLGIWKLWPIILIIIGLGILSGSGKDKK
ncbi:MAG: PspC domain-containing protein [Patescibacteria group bacterium]|jgi:phage shock protein PspC (stress-responsive transcriptional regulator)